MIREALRTERLALRAEDAGLLGGSYVPEMEAVHIRNAARLRELMAVHGWPDEEIAGPDGAEAAWLIVQHAVGEPEFQWAVLRLNRLSAWQAAYLEDRIALFEGRPQRYGTQWIDDHRDGIFRPSRLAEPDRVNELRAMVGLPPLRPIPEPGPDLPFEDQQKIADNQRWWENWFIAKGWQR